LYNNLKCLSILKWRGNPICLTKIFKPLKNIKELNKENNKENNENLLKALWDKVLGIHKTGDQLYHNWIQIATTIRMKIDQHATTNRKEWDNQLIKSTQS
jgi:hypothetical protein